MLIRYSLCTLELLFFYKMTFVQKSGVVHLSDDEERERFINENSELLHDAVIVEKSWMLNKVTFKLLRREKDTWRKSMLIINDIVDFYFRRFETGMIRTGLQNLRRLKLGAGEVEHISVVSYFKHNLTGKDGIQLLLYSGKMLRFLGEKLVFDIEDGDETPNSYPTPEKVETPLTKLLYFPHRIMSKSREFVDKIHETASQVAFERDEGILPPTKIQLEINKKTMISPEFEEFTKVEDEIELDEKQQLLMDNILKRLKEDTEDLEVKEPHEFYEIFDFEDQNSFVTGEKKSDEAKK